MLSLDLIDLDKLFHLGSYLIRNRT